MSMDSRQCWVEEIAHHLYAGGPYGEFICFLDNGARAITDAHTMDVYRGLVEDVVEQAHVVDISVERDMQEAWNRRLVVALREAVSTMKRQMHSDYVLDRPFDEDMADAIRKAEDVLSNG